MIVVTSSDVECGPLFVADPADPDLYTDDGEIDVDYVQVRQWELELQTAVGAYAQSRRTGGRDHTLQQLLTFIAERKALLNGK